MYTDKEKELIAHYLKGTSYCYVYSKYYEGNQILITSSDLNRDTINEILSKQRKDCLVKS